MKTALFFLLAALQLGCGAADTIDNWTTVTVGAGVINPIRVERTVELGSARLSACINASTSNTVTQAKVSLQDTADGCMLSLEMPDVTLLDMQGVAKAHEQIGPFNVDAVREGGIVIETLQIQTGEGAALDLAEYISSISLALNGEALLDHLNPNSLSDEMHKTLALPASVVDALKNAVKTNQPATAAVAVSVVFTSAVMNALPSSINVLLVLQPQIGINPGYAF